MEFSESLPFLRYIHFLHFQGNEQYAVTLGYDCRLFFAYRGSTEITVRTLRHTLEENSLLFIPAGCPYQLCPSRPDTSLIGVNFDFTRRARHLVTPIAPDPVARFRQEEITDPVTFSDISIFREPFLLKEQSALLPDFLLLLDEYATKRFFFSQQNDALLKLVLAQMARAKAAGSSPAPAKTVDRVIQYISTHYAQRLSNEDIGAALSFHPNYLNRLMLKHTGVSLHQYLLNFRLTKAIDLLQTTSLSIKEIAAMTGFGSTAEFSKFFRQKTGKSPSRSRAE